MPENKNIRSVICWLMAVMLLVASMSARSVYQEQAGATNNVPGKSAGINTSQDAAPSDQATISPLSLDAVVISVFSYHFSQYFLPGTLLTITLAEKSCGILPARFDEPLFFFSYFLKIFGKQIAPNAP